MDRFSSERTFHKARYDRIAGIPRGDWFFTRDPSLSFIDTQILYGVFQACAACTWGELRNIDRLFSSKSVFKSEVRFAGYPDIRISGYPPLFPIRGFIRIRLPKIRDPLRLKNSNGAQLSERQKTTPATTRTKRRRRGVKAVL